MALSEKERRIILDRDNRKPQLPIFQDDEVIYGYCDRPQQCPHLEVNHIVNQADGGTDDPKNLITIPKCVHVGICPSGLIKDKYAKR